MSNEVVYKYVYHKHVVRFDPYPSSVRPLFEKMIEPSELLLKGCELLLQDNSFPFERFKTLKSLEISGIGCLFNVPDVISEMTQLQDINLSHLPIKEFPCDAFFSNLTRLRSLVLRGCYNLTSLPPFPRLPALECLDLSELPIEMLPLEDTPYEKLRRLILRGCSRLRSIPPLCFFAKLEILDVSHCTTLQEIRPSSRHGCCNLRNLDHGLPQHDGIGLVEDQFSWLGLVSHPDEFHLVAYFTHKSGFDRFKNEFHMLRTLLSFIEKKINNTSLGKTIFPTTTNLDSSITLNLNSIILRNEMSQVFIKNFRSMHMDLRYILKNISYLESSVNNETCSELLDELMNAVSALSNNDSLLHSIDLQELSCVIFKLKFLVPPPKLKHGKMWFSAQRPRRILLTSIKEEVFDPSTLINQKLISSYESLTNVQKNCLLYMAIFSSPIFKSLLIKKKALFLLWYGEGFVDPASYCNFIEQSQPIQEQLYAHQLDPKSNLEPGTSRFFRLAKSDTSSQVSTTRGVENPRTINEIGQQILDVLEQKGFIKFSGAKMLCIGDYVHYFVKAQAKASLFFDFDDMTGNLTSHLNGSQRACLIRSRAHCPPSCSLWLSYTNSSRGQERLKNIRTLLRVSESNIDLNVEWFSKMRNLIVLDLGGSFFGDEQLDDVVNSEFLEELKNMKQLRLLSLEGLSGIMKLPKSICELTNLRVLNLRHCYLLEELPISIGSVKNLTHLDLTLCYLLSQLPKELALLSQLEVLKGFVITHEVDGQQHEKACTLGELLKLRKLRKLNLVVNRDTFPDSKDLHVFAEMKNLCNLKITWKKDNYNGRGEGPQSDNKGLPLRSNPLPDLKKLVMECFPYETAPFWVCPHELQKLEKLYIIGGALRTLPRDADSNEWSVKTLHLKYLYGLELDLPQVKCFFPNLTSFEAENLRGFRSSVKWPTGEVDASGEATD